MAIVTAVQPHEHSPTWKWTLASGDTAKVLPLPLGGKVLVQVDGDLAGGEVELEAGLLDSHMATMKVFVSENIVTLPPVRFVGASFTGAPEGSTVTVIVAIAP